MLTKGLHFTRFRDLKHVVQRNEDMMGQACDESRPNNLEVALGNREITYVELSRTMLLKRMSGGLLGLPCADCPGSSQLALALLHYKVRYTGARRSHRASSQSQIT